MRTKRPITEARHPLFFDIHSALAAYTRELPYASAGLVHAFTHRQTLPAMDLTKTDIKRTIQGHMADMGMGQGWKKFYALRDGDSGDRLHDLSLDAVGTVEAGQVIDVEATIQGRYGPTKQDWVAFWIGESRIWAKRNAISREDLSDDTLIFSR